MDNLKTLEKGKTYWIDFHDCCVSGSWRGKFRGFAIHESDNVTRFYDTLPEEAVYGEIHFDTGFIGELWAGIQFREIENAV